MLDALGNHLTNKYSEGHLGARYYGGNQHIGGGVRAGLHGGGVHVVRPVLSAGGGGLRVVLVPPTVGAGGGHMLLGPRRVA